MATTPAQEEYLKRVEQGMQRQAATGVARAEKRAARTGMGRHTGTQTGISNLAAQYAQRIGETTGRFRSVAEEAQADREFQTSERVGRQKFGAGQAVLSRAEAAKEREFMKNQAQRAKKKSTWDYVREGAGLLTSLI